MMACTITIKNESGTHQNVAIFVMDTPSDATYSLVWMRESINNSSHATFQLDCLAYGLGWGRTSRPIDIGVQYMSGSDPSPVFPKSARGVNRLPITYTNKDFQSGPPTFDGSPSNLVTIATDASFEVADALKMSVALYIDKQPALALQGKPNVSYIFDTSQLSYYLTVTNAAQGVALPVKDLAKRSGSLSLAAIGMSTPAKIPVGPGVSELKYELTKNLEFQKK